VSTQRPFQDIEEEIVSFVLAWCNKNMNVVKLLCGNSYMRLCFVDWCLQELNRCVIHTVVGGGNTKRSC